MSLINKYLKDNVNNHLVSKIMLIIKYLTIMIHFNIILR